MPKSEDARGEQCQSQIDGIHQHASVRGLLRPNHEAANLG
jgi:hypothetical protein